MTRGRVKEYAEAVRERYWKADRKEKTQLLDEFVRVTGYHRKAAIRLLNSGHKLPSGGTRGRQRTYGLETTSALKVVWEASDRMCSQRLYPFLPELVRVLEDNGELALEAEVKGQLCRMSPSTIDRLLRPYRQRGGRRPFSTTKPGSLLKASIPIRTFSEWDEKRPGFIEVDPSTPLRAGSGGPLWRKHRGILPKYPQCGGYSHRVGGVSGSVG